MHRLDGKEIRAGRQLPGHIGAQILFPRHLLRGQERLRLEHLRSVDPGGNRIPPGSEENGPAHRLGQHYGRPVGEMLLSGLFRAQGLRIRAGDPLGRSVAHRGLFGCLVADPMGAPGGLIEQARLPPGDGALRIGLARRVPQLYPPEVAR